MEITVFFYLKHFYLLICSIYLQNSEKGLKEYVVIQFKIKNHYKINCRYFWYNLSSLFCYSVLEDRLLEKKYLLYFFS